MGIFSFFKRKSKPPKAAKKQKVAYNAGLALSGGGTRGIAHIGAIRAFEEHGIVFSCVAGTSAGSLVGSLYAAGYNSYEIEEFARTLREREIINSRLFFVPSRSSNLENVMRRFLGDTTFKQLKLPFRAICVDVITGEEVVLGEGNVAKAVSASSAVPGVFTPVEWPPYRLIDGGLQNTIPSDVVRSMGADKVVAIDINKARGTGTHSTKVVEILKATFRIAMKSTALKGDLHSDIIVAPDLTKFKSTKIDGFDQMLEIGYNATLEKMDEIKEVLGIKTRFFSAVEPRTEPRTGSRSEPRTGPRTLPLGDLAGVDTPDDTVLPYTKEWFDQLEPTTIEPEIVDKKTLKKAEKEAKAKKKKEKK